MSLKPKKIYSFFFLFISLLFFIYTFYRSEIYNGGLFRTNYLFYYFFSSILIFLAFFYIYSNKKINLYFIITIISVIVGLYFIELYLIFFNSKKTIKNFDTRPLFQFYLDQKKLNKNVTMVFGPSYFFSNSANEKNLLPLSGISNSETIFCNESGEYAFYKSDRFGFNNPDDQWNKFFFEYFIVGDSFAHGACVERPFDIASVLRLKNSNVINLAFQGNGPLTEYATLREYLKPNVKNILWFYYEENDLHDLTKEKKNKILINYLIDFNYSQNLLFKQNSIDNIIKQEIIKIEDKNLFQINSIKNNKIIEHINNFLKIYETRRLIFLILQNIINPIKPTKDFENILFLANKLATENNSKLYFVYLPRYSRYVSNFRQPNINDFKIMMERIGIEFIDIDKEIFKKEADPLSLFPFGSQNHYNALGYSKIANIIYQRTR
jgi:hypothetical protein